MKLRSVHCCPCYATGTLTIPMNGAVMVFQSDEEPYDTLHASLMPGGSQSCGSGRSCVAGTFWSSGACSGPLAHLNLGAAPRRLDEAERHVLPEAVGEAPAVKPARRREPRDGFGASNRPRDARGLQVV